MDLISGQPDTPTLRTALTLAVAGLLVSIVGGLFFAVYDIVHVTRRPTFSGGAKAGWICALCFASVLAIPIYWLTHLRNEPGTFH
jgi:hypothetical protein